MQDAMMHKHPPAQRPNIILILCDDLGYGDTGFNGHSRLKTPNLDRMAAEGQRFTRFHAGGPVCSPTRGTCLTGRHYIRYGINHANQGRLPAGERTLPAILKEQGYRTGHFGKWHLGTIDRTHSCKAGRDPEQHYAPPWERVYDQSFCTEIAVPLWNPQQGFDQRNQRRLETPWISPYYRNGKRVDEPLTGCDSQIIVDELLPFIDEANASGEPFFATLWFHAPHTPVEAGPEWLALYGDMDENTAHYYGCVSAMDAQVGRLLDRLTSLGIDRQTMTWFASDNGPEGTGHGPRWPRSRGSTAGLRGRKRSLYNGGITVPAVCHWPGTIEAGSLCQTPCSTLDYLPTICAELGLPLEEAIGDQRPIDGIDLSAILRGQQSRRHTPIPFRFMGNKQAMADSPTLALIGDDFKFLSNLQDDGADAWFDPVADPYEADDLITSRPAEAAERRRQLEAFLASCRASHQGQDYAFDPITPFQEPSSWE
jgi:arylsulfatase A-like enzyme